MASHAPRHVESRGRADEIDSSDSFESKHATAPDKANTKLSTLILTGPPDDHRGRDYVGKNGREGRSEQLLRIGDIKMRASESPAGRHREGVHGRETMASSVRAGSAVLRPTDGTPCSTFGSCPARFADCRGEASRSMRALASSKEPARCEPTRAWSCRLAAAGHTSTLSSACRDARRWQRNVRLDGPHMPRRVLTSLYVRQSASYR